MHEIALIESLMDSLTQNAAKHGVTRITRVKLVVGELHGALPDALKFAFEVLSAGTLAEGAEIDFDEEQVICRCRSCGHSFPWKDRRRNCPLCEGESIYTEGGRSVYLDFFEGEE